MLKILLLKHANNNLHMKIKIKINIMIHEAYLSPINDYKSYV